jgi:SAM-dependent methyltransferase
MLKGLAEFCEVGPDDDVLDVACGTGAFALYAARGARRVVGLDVSAGMIDIAARKVAEQGLRTVEFRLCDVERVSCADRSFSVVVSRSAFHHMPRPGAVLAEMVRCCRPGGTVCVQDVIAYGTAADEFFERFEVLVDRSHHRSYGKRDLFDLFTGRPVRLEAVFESETLLDVHDYVRHTAHSNEDRARIEEALARGRRDPDVARWLVERDGRLLWRRRICTLRGRRRAAASPAGANTEGTAT